MNKILQGDCLEILQTLESESVDCVITSPPYWQLRDYNIDGQLGLEPTFVEYISKLVTVFDEVKRILKKEGTCWINMGDAYNNNPSNMGIPNTGQPKRLSETKRQSRIQPKIGIKSLLMIPSRFAIAMIDSGWILRNDIIWHKPNCMPESVKDRFTTDYEHLFFFVKQKKYYFKQMFEDMICVKERGGGIKYVNIGHTGLSEWQKDSNGRNKRTVWTIPTQPSSEEHYASYPDKLVQIPIEAGCPDQICKKCGNARERMYEGTSKSAFNIRVRDVKENRIKHTDRIASQYEIDNYQEGATHVGEGRIDKGLTDCGCNAGWNKGTVLDPFCGTATTCYVAKEMGRNYIGIDLKKEYCDISEKRLRQYMLAI